MTFEKKNQIAIPYRFGNVITDCQTKLIIWAIQIPHLRIPNTRRVTILVSDRTLLCSTWVNPWSTQCLVSIYRETAFRAYSHAYPLLIISDIIRVQLGAITFMPQNFWLFSIRTTTTIVLVDSNLTIVQGNFRNVDRSTSITNEGSFNVLHESVHTGQPSPSNPTVLCKLYYWPLKLVGHWSTIIAKFQLQLWWCILLLPPSVVMVIQRDLRFLQVRGCSFMHLLKFIRLL